ncbi:peptidase domain-containing ABC transporter [Vibrio jasicida]|uniref:peptidase domain-containing ABC transporter n=1 Tax=Vibrio jasicida TaxID=766224 RepID=UPI0005F039EB|nr:cysteine peptidase family C39 domain-containing protein [Vibrio jasicida]
MYLFRKLSLVLQSESHECGLACLTMISNYYGSNIKLRYVRELSSYTNGQNLYDVANLAKKLKLSSRALKISPERIQNNQLPAIVHFDMNHFVVLSKIKNGQYIIHDPAVGCIRLDKDGFSQRFTGILLELYSDEMATLISQDDVSIKLSSAIRPVLADHNFYLILFSLILVQVILLLTPIYFRELLSNANLVGGSEALNILTIAIVLLITLEFSLSLFSISKTNILCRLYKERIVKNSFEHLISLPSLFFERRNSSYLYTSFNSLYEIIEVSTVGFINLIADKILLSFSLLVLFVFDYRLFSFILLVSILYVALRYFPLSKLCEIKDKAKSLQRDELGFFYDVIKSIDTIKIFQKENYVSDNWSNKTIEKSSNTGMLYFINSLYASIDRYILMLLTILATFIYVNADNRSYTEISSIIILFIYIRLYYDKLSSIVDFYIKKRLISMDLDRVNDIFLEQKEPIHNSPRYLNDSSMFKELIVDNVSIHNPNGSRLISDINLVVRPGDSIAIVGPSGSGKTSLLRALIGLKNVNQGEITLDGINIRDDSRYRRKISCVLQNDRIITGSILDNICFFDEHCDLKLAISAANSASIHDVISQLPMGYHTIISEDNCFLSGGQVQRILIARALYKKPDILFMDEATSSLDKESEIKINFNLKKINVAKVFISHRTETISSADYVYRIINNSIQLVSSETEKVNVK